MPRAKLARSLLHYGHIPSTKAATLAESVQEGKGEQVGSAVAEVIKSAVHNFNKGT
jgi:hypothetical protein